MNGIGGADRRRIGAVSGAAPAPSASAGSVASNAMNGIASRMASSVATLLKLAGDEGGGSSWQGGDPYEVDALANELGGQLAGSAADKGRLSHSLHEFVREGAALFLARPEAKALAHIEAAIGAAGQDGTLADARAVANAVDRATEAIKKEL